MSEFERRLTRALEERAASPVTTEGLAEGARRRARSRRRAGVLAGVTGVLVVAMGLPLALGLTDREAPVSGPAVSIGSTPPATGAPGDISWVPDGWRLESWRGLEVAVPGEWEYGSLEDWCAGGGRLPHRVDRPGGGVMSIGCPSLSYGLRFLPTDEIPRGPEEGDALLASMPPDYAVGWQEVGDAAVMVVTDDGELTKQVLGTVREADARDGNGCPVRQELPALGSADWEGGGEAGLPQGDPVSVCRYAAGLDGPNLEQSELLDEEGSRLAAEAVLKAPEGSGPDAGPDSCVQWSEEQAVALVAGERVLAWVHYDGCDGHGVDLPGGSRELTAAVLHWALSPGWSGGLVGEVPLGDLRGQATR